MTTEFATRNDWLAEARNKLTILLGCAEAIERDTRNSLDARHKARVMTREIEELTAMAYHVRTVRSSDNEEESH